MTLAGRLKDVIIRKGENISAKEIEQLLYAHPKVGDVAVIGLPDADRGERVCAVVERKPGLPALGFAEMASYLRASGLMLQKIPEQLEVVDELTVGSSATRPATCPAGRTPASRRPSTKAARVSIGARRRSSSRR